MALFHWSTIFQLTTEPVSAAVATPRTGGWTEGFWTQMPTVAALPLANAMWTMRAKMLPRTCSIQGYRIQEYQLAGNKLLPLGATNVRKHYPGFALHITDVPQLSITINFKGLTQQNATSMKLSGFPDKYATGGEFNPIGTIIGDLANYLQALAILDAGFVGRDLSLPTVRVDSLLPGLLPNQSILTTAAPIPGIVNGDYIRLLRVYDDDKNPVSGAYRVSASAPGVYTINGKIAGTVTNPSGLARKDMAIFVQSQIGTVGKVELRKIGRPITGYRGRASNRR